MTNRLQGIVPRCMLLCGILLAIVSDTVRAPAQTSEMIKRSSIIFVGTVVRLQAVSFPAVPRSRKTAVVKVNRVIEKPATVTLSAGQEVTVELKDPAKIKEGTSAIFYTQGWILGQGVAVREVGHGVPTVTAMAAPGQIEKQVAQARQQHADAALRARIRNADMVVVGRVSIVRKAAVAAEGKKFITEHDPEWHEATIKVESAMKGAQGGDEIVVRFPGSNDVMYRDAPRFKADQEGVFILKKDVVTGLPKVMVGAARVDAYVVQQSADMLPRADTSRVKLLMKRK